MKTKHNDFDFMWMHLTPVRFLTLDIMLVGMSRNKVYKYFSGVDRAEDFDIIFEFYAKHMPQMPVVRPDIIDMLSQLVASLTPESLFSDGRFVPNDYRTRTATALSAPRSSFFLPPD
jgi:hypothetical protein